MSIKTSFQNLFRGSNQKTGAKAFGDNWINIGASADVVNERNLLSANKEWVFIAVDRIANSAAGVRFKVMRYDRAGDDQEVFNGPLVKFLEKPGKGYTGKDFVYLNTVYKELTGNSFWEIIAKGNLKPLLPNEVRAQVSGGELTAFIHRKGGVDRTIKLEEMLHDRYIDPARPYWGAGKLQKIARWVDTSSFANDILSSFFKNGAVFGGFISTEEESMERIKLIKAGLANDHTGVANWFKWAVLPKGAKAQKTTANMAEMEMGATDDRYRDKILAGFGVPKSLVGLTDNVQRGNYEAAEYSFSKNTVKPVVDDLLEFLNIYIAPTLDSSGRYYFDYDEFVPQDKTIVIEERKVALAGQSYKTINEVRSDEGLPPVNGGDVIYGTPFQMPIGSSVQNPELPLEPDDPDEKKIPIKLPKQRSRSASTRLRSVMAKEGQDGLFKAIANAAKQAQVVTKDEDSSPDAVRDIADALAHKGFVGRVESYFERVMNAVHLFNSEQKQRVISDLAHITKSVNKTDLFDFTEETTIMVNFVEPLLRGLMTEQALSEYIAQGFEGEFDSGAKRLEKTVNYAAKRLAKTYNNTTAKLLKVALSEGIKEGEGLAQLTKRVQDVYEFSNVYRAKTVAHTETFYIANKGNLEAYRQSGVVKTQRWYTADADACQYCTPMNGKTIGLSENYFNKGDTVKGADGGTIVLNYRSMDVPPIHTNCRCFIRPEEITID